MNTLKSVRIKQFKRISDAPFDLKKVNILIGGNNSGKSSIIQGLHFGIGLLQTIGLEGKWPSASESLSTSLNPNQLIYSPSENAYALGLGGNLYETADKAISFEFNLASGESCSVTARKGRNRNLLVGVKNAQIAKRLSSLEKPFSIFSPGLAGIAKREAYVSDGVLLRTLARGDANLVLRNILLRLWETPAWNSFLNDLHDVFKGVEFKIDFDNKTDESIGVSIKTTGGWVPLEIAGTGVLQATQILSYIHRFGPSIIVLDEPDSHLHPNNQRLLCALLRRVAEERNTQVLLTTHSRHVVDAVGASAGFLWVRNGDVDIAGPDDEIGILLDIGALDVKERAGQANTQAVVLTEDEITTPLEKVLESSGFDLSRTCLLPYYGITTIKQLRPLVKVIQGTNPKAKIVVHRDRDFLTDSESEMWKKDVRAIGVEPFVTVRRDIESQFINAKYLSEANPGVSETEFDDIIRTAITKEESAIIADYVNGRIEIARKSNQGGKVNPGALAVEATNTVSAEVLKYCGRSVLRAIRLEYRSRYNKNMLLNLNSDHLKDDTLTVIAKKAFRSQPRLLKRIRN